VTPAAQNVDCSVRFSGRRTTNRVRLHCSRCSSRCGRKSAALIMVWNPASLSESRTGPASPGTASPAQMMASPHALLETQALKQLAQIVKTDGRIGGAAEKQSQCLLSSHSHILRPNRKDAWFAVRRKRVRRSADTAA
jgi:hypothetical protein